MTGNALERGAAGTLILILPFAFALVILYTAWPVLLVILALGLAWKIWQHYQWKRWNAQISPYFQRLINDNQGLITATDLAIKANLTGGAARRFLDKKAEEYGAQRQTKEDQGTVYYFLTASALGSIFADSDPIAELLADDSEVVAAVATEPETEDVAEASSEDSPTPQAEEEGETEAVTQPTDTEESEEDTEAAATQELATAEENSNVLIQAELADRFGVHSSTVGKRKSDPDFGEWSQEKDPDGIAWQYNEAEKVFVPLER
jgi:hypothetical protein